MTKISKGHYEYKGYTVKLVKEQSGLERSYWTCNKITDGSYAEGSDTRKDIVALIDRYEKDHIGISRG